MPEVDNSGTLSIREALKLFALKDEVVGINAAVATMAAAIDKLVPRAEHELHWKNDDERYDGLRSELQNVNGKLDDIKADRLPKWFLPAMAVAAPALLLLISHYWR